MRRLLRSGCVCLFLAVCAYAGNPRPGYETQWQANLRNGFSIRHVMHEIVGANTRLWITPGKSYVDVPTDQITGFEEIEVPIVSATRVAAPKPSPRVEDLVTEAGKRTAIDPAFIASVIKAESGNNPRAVSPRGARGLMQLMPQTASQLGVANSFDPSANVDGGTRYLRELLEQYHGDAKKALAAYNAGPHRVQQYGGVPPYSETRAYVARVINDYNRRKLAQQRSRRASRHSTPKPDQPAAE